MADSLWDHARRSIPEQAQGLLGGLTNAGPKQMVGGPVDLAAGLLGLLGVPVGDKPVGGSRWIDEKMGLLGVPRMTGSPMEQYGSAVFGAAGMPAMQAAGRAAYATEQALAPKAADMAESFLRKRGMMSDVIPPSKDFANTRISDSKGAPMVVYHGSPAQGDGIKQFDLQRAGSRTDAGYLGEGFYFGDPRTASNYAGFYEFGGMPPSAGAVYPVYVNAKNPLKLDAPRVGQRVTDREVLIRNTLGLPPSASAKEVTAAARARGYDAVHYTDEFGLPEVVAFDPSQIQWALSR